MWKLPSMSYRVRLNQCYLVPCYQHTANKKVSFEDDLEDTSSAEPQFHLPLSHMSTISPMSSGTLLNNVENQEEPIFSTCLVKMHYEIVHSDSKQKKECFKSIF